MRFLQEFKEFAVKGNVIDLAVGVIIGAAFGKIVTSLVEDIVMPPIGYIIQGVDFSQLGYTIGTNAEGEVVRINVGNFINNILHFVLVALAIFVVVKQFNKIKRKAQALPPSTKTCRFCKEPVNVEAIKCKFCTGDLSSAV